MHERQLHPPERFPFRGGEREEEEKNTEAFIRWSVNRNDFHLHTTAFQLLSRFERESLRPQSRNMNEPIRSRSISATAIAHR